MANVLPSVDFDRTINSSLPAEALWRLMRQAFEDPGRSPIWPVELEESDAVELAEGATVVATYKLGPVEVRPCYHITDLEEGRSFSYRSDASHPLDGGATVVVRGRNGGSALRWYGSYRPRLHPLAPGALLFVRLYFLRTFFARLEENLRLYEAG